MSKKNLTYNLTANLTSFIVATGISFFLAPYIIKAVGIEAYGFISLANSFVGYVTLATIALNSMAARFVTIKVHQDDIEGANKYFSSVIIANCIISVTLIIPFILVIVFINRIINVPIYLLSDVRILFSLIFTGFFISLITSLFSVGVFIKNKIYLSSLRSIDSGIIRAVLIIILFSVFPAKVFFISFVALIVQLYSVFWNIYYTRKLVPQLTVKKKYFNKKAILELVSAGVWNLVNKISGTLSTGLDLLICNLLIGTRLMGVLAISDTIPQIISALLGNLTSAFAPDLTKFYANNDFSGMVKILNRSIKILSIFITIPLGGFIIFGDIFYKLWLPLQNSNQLLILSILKVMCLMLTGSTASIHAIFEITNKLKLQSLVTLITCSLSIIITLILLKNSNLGVYAVAGVSSTLAILQNLIFTFPYAAKCINQKWYTFYYPALRTSFLIAIIALIGFIFRHIFIIDTWVELIFFGVTTGIVSLAINIKIILSKEEKGFLLNIVKSRLKFNSQ